MERMVSESYLNFTERVSQALTDGNIDYPEWAESILGEVPYSDENLRRAFIVFDKFMKRLDQEEIKTLNNSERVREIEKAKEELIKERKKLQITNSELQATYREQSRYELFGERVEEAIRNLTPTEIKHFNHTEDEGTTALLCVSDFHCGSDYTVYGPSVGGKQEIINQYNFEIMKARLWKLLSLVEFDDVPFSELYIGMLGDFFENVLRLSSLAKIKEPVIDSVIKFSDFICTWITEVYNRLKVPITVVTVGGNHDSNALLQSGGNRMEEENLAKLVVHFMEIRFENCENIIIKPYSDVSIETIRKTNIMFNHGEDKDLQTTIDYFSNFAQIDCDEIIAGHLHRPESKTIGICDVGDRIITRVGSICGVDVFSKKIRASARPSGYMALYTDEGKSWSKNYYLG